MTARERILCLNKEGKSLLEICVQLVKVEKLGTLYEINILARDVLDIPQVKKALQPSFDATNN